MYVENILNSILISANLMLYVSTVTIDKTLTVPWYLYQYMNTYQDIMNVKCTSILLVHIMFQSTYVPYSTVRNVKTCTR